MNRKQITIALSAAALSLSAVAANAAQFVHIGDENNLDWLPATKAAPIQHTEFQGTTSSQFVHIGDENNLDWLPTPAKR
jgi:hypothetical protein